MQRKIRKRPSLFNAELFRLAAMSICTSIGNDKDVWQETMGPRQSRRLLERGREIFMRSCVDVAVIITTTVLRSSIISFRSTRPARESRAFPKHLRVRASTQTLAFTIRPIDYLFLHHFQLPKQPGFLLSST
jgi:hypothetical protein